MVKSLKAIPKIYSQNLHSVLNDHPLKSINYFKDVASVTEETDPPHISTKKEKQEVLLFKLRWEQNSGSSEDTTWDGYFPSHLTRG